MIRRFIFATLLLLPLIGGAQVSFTGAAYTQNFDTLQGSPNNTTGVTWTDNSSLAGWYSDRTSYGVTDATMGGSAAAFDDTGVAANVGLFSFGASGSTERAIGSRPNTAMGQVQYGVRLQNTTGGTITGFTIVFTGEQWFKSTSSNAHVITTDFSTDATALATGTWTTMSTATFSAPTTAGTTPTALDGNAAANKRRLMAVVSGITWNAGADLWIRFTDGNESGSEQGLGIDDFIFTTTPTSTLPYFQTFDSMGTAGTAAPAGWSFFGALGGDNNTWSNATGIPAADIGGGTLNNVLTATTSFAVSSNTAGYNFALSTATADRCIGTSPTSGRGILWQLALTNGTGAVINAVRMSYDIRRFTAPATANQLPGYWLFASVDGGTSWTNVSALNPALASGTVQVPNTAGVTSVSDVAVALGGAWTAGSELRLRWVDDNATETSPDQVIGLDNVFIEPSIGSGTLTRGPYLNQANQNSIVVRWRSSLPVVGRVRYGTSSGSLTQSVDETVATGEHIVQLTGLAPFTRYYYSIGSAVDTLAGGDAEHTFRTSPLPGTATDTRIWVLGDAGRANANQAAVRDAYYLWTGARTPDLCLMLGDNAYNSGTDAEYQSAVYNMYPAFLRKMPLWSCLGNHDANNGSTSSTANFPYFDMFTFPTNAECGGVASGQERYFSFDYGNIHFINLDSQSSDRSTIEINGSDGPMAMWLRNDLAGVTATWIIAFFHHPPYSKGSHDSDLESQLIQMRDRFGRILEGGGVDLVLTGHSHSYERSFFLDGHYDVSGTFTAAHKKQTGNGRPAGDGAYLKPLTGPRDHFGAVYTLTGSAGSADGGALNHPAMFVSYNTLGSFNIDINGNQLDATYIESDNDLADTFTIIKQGAADSDGDGVADAFEIAHGMNRFSAADATLDTDFDGNTALEEYLFAINPAVSDRYGWTTTKNPITGHVDVTFPTQPQRTYQVLWSANLTNWFPGSSIVTGDGATKTWTDDGTVTGSAPGATTKRFYRVQVSNGP